MEGAVVGTMDGAAVGTIDGAVVGAIDGAVVGAIDGAIVGTMDGTVVGTSVGVVVAGAAVTGAEVVAGMPVSRVSTILLVYASLPSTTMYRNTRYVMLVSSGRY
jgi:hypothetical protein